MNVRTLIARMQNILLTIGLVGLTGALFSNPASQAQDSESRLLKGIGQIVTIYDNAGQAGKLYVTLKGPNVAKIGDTVYIQHDGNLVSVDDISDNPETHRALLKALENTDAGDVLSAITKVGLKSPRLYFDESGKLLAAIADSRPDVAPCNVAIAGGIECGAEIEDNGGVAQIVAHPEIDDSIPADIAKGFNMALKKAVIRFSDVAGTEAKVRFDESVAFCRFAENKIMVIVETKSGMFIAIANGKLSGDYFDQEKMAKLPEATRLKFKKMVGF
jgi:hypothetical protein